MSKNLFLIVGCSGSGKTTIAERLESEFGLKSLVSYTSRPRRVPDEQGHIFVTKSQFDELSNKVAYTKFDGYEYCATAEQIDNSDIYIIDPKGVKTFCELYKGDKKIYTIYITTRLRDRYDRMRIRGDSCEQALERLINDAGEFKGFEKECDFIIRNDNCDKIENVVGDIKVFIDEVNEKN